MSECACEYPCRSSGRPSEPIRRLPEPGAAACGRCSPRTKGNLCPRWPAEKAPPGRPGHGLLRVDAGGREEQRRK